MSTARRLPCQRCGNDVWHTTEAVVEIGVFRRIFQLCDECALTLENVLRSTMNEPRKVDPRAYGCSE